MTPEKCGLDLSTSLTAELANTSKSFLCFPREPLHSAPMTFRAPALSISACQVERKGMVMNHGYRARMHR
jgi:hypothetical protein